MKFPKDVRLVFLDRDGVVNELIGPEFNRGPRTISELVIRDDFLDFYQMQQDRNLIFAVVTNQPDIARKKLSSEDNHLISSAIKSCFTRGLIYRECPHDNSDKCKCRKPKPGMILQVLSEISIPAEKSILIGDSWTDIMAANAAGIFSILLSREGAYQATSQGSPPETVKPDLVVSKLSDLDKFFLLES